MDQAREVSLEGTDFGEVDAGMREFAEHGLGEHRVQRDVQLAAIRVAGVAGQQSEALPATVTVLGDDRDGPQALDTLADGPADNRDAPTIGRPQPLLYRNLRGIGSCSGAGASQPLKSLHGLSVSGQWC